MSCLGPRYKPEPPREWNRFENNCSRINLLTNTSNANLTNLSIYEMYPKSNILQYKANSSHLTKNQRYGQIARGMWTNRTTTWATQSDKYTNPNTQFLKRSNYSELVIDDNNIIDNTTTPSPIIINGDCQPTPPVNNNIVLPQTASGGGPNPIIPPQPTTPGSTTILPPPVPTEPNIEVVIKDGGSLICNSVEIPCTSISSQTKSNPIHFFPGTNSDVPGTPSVLLGWNDSLPTYYPRVRRTYGTSGDK